MKDASPATAIRPECLRPAETWTAPTGDEVRHVLSLTGFTVVEAARFLDMAVHRVGGRLNSLTNRQIYRWLQGDVPIPYPHWALLCSAAGLGEIWRDGAA